MSVSPPVQQSRTQLFPEEIWSLIAHVAHLEDSVIPLSCTNKAFRAVCTPFLYRRLTCRHMLGLLKLYFIATSQHARYVKHITIETPRFFSDQPSYRTGEQCEEVGRMYMALAAIRFATPEQKHMVLHALAVVMGISGSQSFESTYQSYRVSLKMQGLAAEIKPMAYQETLGAAPSAETLVDCLRSAYQTVFKEAMAFLQPHMPFFDSFAVVTQDQNHVLPNPDSGQIFQWICQNTNPKSLYLSYTHGLGGVRAPLPSLQTLHLHYPGWTIHDNQVAIAKILALSAETVENLILVLPDDEDDVVFYMEQEETRWPCLKHLRLAITTSPCGSGFHIGFNNGARISKVMHCPALLSLDINNHTIIPTIKTTTLRRLRCWVDVDMYEVDYSWLEGDNTKELESLTVIVHVEKQHSIPNVLTKICKIVPSKVSALRLETPQSVLESTLYSLVEVLASASARSPPPLQQFTLYNGATDSSVPWIYDVGMLRRSLPFIQQIGIMNVA